MVLKRVDRYVSRAFLLRFVGLLCLIGALYASFDLLKRLEEVRRGEAGRDLATLASYYAHLLPVFLLDVVPGAILVSAGMILVHMAKARELLALKACGASLHRVLAPVFFWAFLISVAAFAVREVAGPQLTRQKDILGHVLGDRVESRLLVSDPAHSRKVFIGRYDFATRQMEGVWLMEFFPNGAVSRTVWADEAELKPGGVLAMESVELREFDADGVAKSKPTLVPQLEVQAGLTPLVLAQAAEKGRAEGMMLRTLPELREQMRANPGVPFFRVAFHSRLASFFSPIILLLVGLPFLVGFERSVDSRFLGVLVCILVAGGLYGLTFVFSSMGNTGVLSPLLAGWLPSIFTGAAGLWLFEAMLT